MSPEEQIQFFFEDIDEYPLPDLDRTKRWITKIINSHQGQLEGINYILCSDEYLHKINVEYLDHDTYTDIITFDNSEEEGIIEGDIYISIERIKENAYQHSTAYQDEFHRVMAHGVLHLLGFKDKTKDEQETMRKKEEACLSLYPNS